MLFTHKNINSIIERIEYLKTKYTTFNPEKNSYKAIITLTPSKYDYSFNIYADNIKEMKDSLLKIGGMRNIFRCEVIMIDRNDSKI